MFTGIVEEIGSVSSVLSDKITIKCSTILQDIKLGDSIAVNGVCLTVREVGSDWFSADISPETLKVTTLSELKINSQVNLERALTLTSRLGGHIVSGHVDSVAEIFKMNKFDDFYELIVKFEKSFDKYVVKKGSITLNGISLTVADCKTEGLNTYCTVAIIPHTFNNTCLKSLKSGDKLNIEFDILAKYVEKNLLSSDNNNITADFLEQNGFC